MVVPIQEIRSNKKLQNKYWISKIFIIGWLYFLSGVFHPWYDNVITIRKTTSRFHNFAIKWTHALRISLDLSNNLRVDFLLNRFGYMFSELFSSCTSHLCESRIRKIGKQLGSIPVSYIYQLSLETFTLSMRLRFYWYGVFNPQWTTTLFHFISFSITHHSHLCFFHYNNIINDSVFLQWVLRHCF